MKFELHKRYLKETTKTQQMKSRNEERKRKLKEIKSENYQSLRSPCISLQPGDSMTKASTHNRSVSSSFTRKTTLQISATDASGEHIKTCAEITLPKQAETMQQNAIGQNDSLTSTFVSVRGAAEESIGKNKQILPLGRPKKQRKPLDCFETFEDMNKPSHKQTTHL